MAQKNPKFKSCFVDGCSFGCNNYTGPRRSRFHFPEDPERKAQWIAAINRTNRAVTKSSMVCDAHFERRFILDGFLKRGPNGTIIYKSRPKKALRDDAVPTIFFNDTGVTDEQDSPPQDDVDNTPHIDVIVLPAEETITEISLAGAPTPTYGVVIRINNFEALLRLLENKVEIPEEMRLDTKWSTSCKRPGKYAAGGAAALVFQLDLNVPVPKFKKCFKVDTSLLAVAYFKESDVTSQVFGALRNCREGCRISTWNQVFGLVQALDNYNPDDINFDYNVPLRPADPSQGNLINAMAAYKAHLQNQRPVNRETICKLNFCMEQISLLGKLESQRTFSDQLRRWTKTIDRISPQALTFLNTSAALVLPDVSEQLPDFMNESNPVNITAEIVGTTSASV